MGLISFVTCKDCKVTRDLDKLRTATTVETRDDALSHAENVAKSAFRPALLVSFMAEHIGHDCVFYNEHHDSLCEAYGEFEDNGFRMDRDFFQ